MAAEDGVAAEFGDLADEFLTGVVLRVGFASEDQLDGTGAVSEDSTQAIEVVEDQCCALISGEAAGEADGERVGIEDFCGGIEFGLRGGTMRTLGANAATSPCDKTLAATLVSSPQL